MTPLVSVVIPAYNAGEYIEASAGSALAQSFSNLEVLVVNDGSTDDTADRLKRINDPRLRITGGPHLGLVAAYNAGIRESRGTYVAFLDADDLWLPDKLARHLEAHETHPGVDATFCWVSVIDSAGKLLGIPCPRPRGAVSFGELLSDYMVRTMSAVVIRRTAAEDAGGFDPSFTRCVDLEFLLRVALLRPDNVKAVPEQLTLYRRHDGQRTRDWRPMREGWNQLLASIARHAPKETAEVQRLASSNMHRYFAALAYESGKFGEAMDLTRRSFSLNPRAFLTDSRSWKMGAAAAAGVTLPRQMLFAIERFAGFNRSG